MSTRHAAALLGVLLVLAPVAPYAQTSVDPVDVHVPDAELVGEGRLKVMLWSVFDARLEAPAGRYSPDAPFALSLSYLRRIEAEEIVDASIDEMAAGTDVDAPTLARWRASLVAIIPDVDEGTTLIGVRDEAGHAIFYRDGKPIGEVEDRAFARAFFDIWLGDASSRPELRDRLLASSSS